MGSYRIGWKGRCLGSDGDGSKEAQVASCGLLRCKSIFLIGLNAHLGISDSTRHPVCSKCRPVRLCHAGHTAPFADLM